MYALSIDVRLTLSLRWQQSYWSYWTAVFQTSEVPKHVLCVYTIPFCCKGLDIQGGQCRFRYKCSNSVDWMIEGFGFFSSDGFLHLLSRFLSHSDYVSRLLFSVNTKARCCFEKRKVKSESLSWALVCQRWVFLRKITNSTMSAKFYIAQACIAQFDPGLRV